MGFIPPKHLFTINATDCLNSYETATHVILDYNTRVLLTNGHKYSVVLGHFKKPVNVLGEPPLV